jgi:penicillin-binding protein 1A
VSDYNEHSSLYENSDYPSRRQAPSRRSSGGARQAPTPPKKRRRRKKGGITAGRVIGWFFKLVGTLILIGLCTGALIACFASVYINEVIVPIADVSPDDFSWNEDSIMYYQDKTTGQYVEMTKLNNITSSVWVDYDEIPEDLINAAVAIEDKRFWTHPGVDWRRTAYAVYSMFTGKEISGGSTITQQLLKNTTQYNETTVKRKITEIIRALRFTQNNSKEDTLMYYLNVIPLGSKYKGVGSAALGYFGKPVSELTLAECASLIGITNNPSKYGPYSFSRSQGFNTDEIWSARQWNKYRQEVILNQMLEQHYITREEYDEAVAQELVFVKEQGGSNDELYSWYEETVISDVKEIMAEQYGWSSTITEQAMQRGGLRIYTCYDPAAQAIVDEIYTNRDNLDYTSKDGQQMQSTIAVIENDTGNLVAIAGQFGEKTVPFGSNYANDGHRQPGSSFKPLAVYSPALEFNLLNPYSVLDDYPYQVMGGKAWPLNSGTTTYRGHLTMREALMRSLNTVAVRIMLDYVTPEESFKFVQDRYHIDLEEGRMVKGEWKTDMTSSLAMGGLTDGTNVRDMAEAYSVFPNNGVYQGSRTVLRITQLVDGQEVLLVDNELEQEQVIKQTTAWYMNDMMQHVFDAAGTAYGLGIKGQHAAGKTGTTSENFDRWFAGYTPYYTAVVWVGYENPYKMSLAGKNPAAVLWNKVMVPLHEGLEDRTYDDPGGRRTINYCMDSGYLATEYCSMDPRGSRVASGSIFPESFPEGVPCPYHTAESVLTICVDCPVLKDDGSQTGLYYQAGEFCPEESKREICLPNFGREQVGAAVANDAIWDYAAASGYGGCTVHTSAPVEDPIDPAVDPNNPFFPNVPIPGGTATEPGGTTDPSTVTQPDPPDVPINPLPPSENMAG